MTEDIAAIDWARAQFAMTIMFHFLFVPLTLGLSFLIAFMESIYYITNNPLWKTLTQFWIRLFAINFAIGIATGLIMEFQFGTNWSRFSWIVGDIFGAPLAIEGIVAFFLEATFFVVMIFGWHRVSKGFHLFATWMVAVGSSLSAFWILVANGWMQYPVGTRFNPDQVRFELIDFWAVALSPVGLSKYFHTVLSGFVVSSLFVLGISSWYLLKKRHIEFAKKSLLVASIFGLISSLGVAVSGDHAAYYVGKTQPMKLAAMEGLYTGSTQAPLVVFGLFNHNKKLRDDQPNFYLKMEVPKMLSLLNSRDADAFVPGIEDLVYGNPKQGILSAQERIDKGKMAVQALSSYKELTKAGNLEAATQQKKILEDNIEHFGFANLKKPEDLVPPIAINVHSFHTMVMLGFYFIFLFGGVLLLIKLDLLEKYSFVLWVNLFSIPLGYLATQLGWIVAEVGRQPWLIQNYLLTANGAGQVQSASVQLTFFLFLALFLVLFIAEIKIMLKQIQIGLGHD